MHLERAGNLPDTDETISVAREQGGSIGRPGKGDTLWVLGLLAALKEFRAELINNGLGLEIPDLDARVGGSAQPVAVRREGEGVDNIASLKRVEMLGVVQVPEHDNTVLATGSAKRTVRADSDSVDITSVANVVGSELALGEFPNLDNLVPTARDDDGVGRVRREADARDPLGVAVFSDVVLALSQGVPQLDGLVARTGNNLTVVSRERNGENIVGVTDETTSGGTSVQIPKADGLVPGSRQSELSIRGDSNIFDKVVMANKRLAGNAIVGFIPINRF